VNNTDLYFKKLNQKSIFLYDFCNSLMNHLSEEKRKKLVNLADFKVFKVKNDHVLKEPILKKIHEQFEISFAGIFILEKNTGCNFHIDEPRKATINMLLSSGVSHSIFKKEDKDSDNIYQYEFEELIFEEKTFYLYNVTKEHAVINLDKTRYMFSIKFEDSNLNYNELFKWCQENHLLENQDINE
jgi:hypothetical protein